MIERVFDRYIWGARVAPAAISALPLIAALVAWFDKLADRLQPLVSLPVTGLLLILLAHVARDLGKKLEPQLFAKWGGAPTTVLLRQGSQLPSIIRLRILERLAKETGVEAPSRAVEATNPAAADDTYALYTRHLRNRTSDPDKFRILFGENLDYGFRRNMLALKPVGVTMASASMLAIAVRLVGVGARTPDRMLAAVAGFVCLTLLLCWHWVVTADWVRVAAFRYAEKLFEAAESLPAER